MRRLVPPLVGGAVALTTSMGLGLVLGLLGGSPVGVGDNGDGYRLFCAAGLRPDTPELNATWRGVVVTTFTTGHAPCGPPASSAAVVLAATVGDGPSWSLSALAWAYVGLTALGAGLAAAALSVDAPRRAALVALPLAPLVAVPWWSRFGLSSYAEPAGLLGTVWLVLGLLVVAGTVRERRAARLTALALIVAGGLMAMTAKPGFAPIGALAVAAAVVVAVGPRGRLRSRLPGLVAATLVVVLGAGPLLDAVRTQERDYGAINTHNLVFTVLLPELGPAVLPRLGLPPEAARGGGESYYWAGARDIAGWDAAIGRRPDAARADAQAVLAEQPGTAVRVVVRALSATLRPALPYLPSAPRGSAPEQGELRTIYPEAGPVGDAQRAYLDGIALGWLPSAMASVAVVAGLVSLIPPAHRRRRGRSTASGLVRIAAVASLGAVGIAGLAVVGDGFYELTKHMWLASYLLVTSGLVLLTAAALATRRVTRTYRRGRRGDKRRAHPYMTATLLVRSSLLLWCSRRTE